MWITALLLPLYLAVAFAHPTHEVSDTGNSPRGLHPLRRDVLDAAGVARRGSSILEPFSDALLVRMPEISPAGNTKRDANNGSDVTHFNCDSPNAHETLPHNYEEFLKRVHGIIAQQKGLMLSGCIYPGLESAIKLYLTAAAQYTTTSKQAEAVWMLNEIFAGQDGVSFIVNITVSDADRIGEFLDDFANVFFDEDYDDDNSEVEDDDDDDDRSVPDDDGTTVFLYTRNGNVTFYAEDLFDTFFRNDTSSSGNHTKRSVGNKFSKRQEPVLQCSPTSSGHSPTADNVRALAAKLQSEPGDCCVQSSHGSCRVMDRSDNTAAEICAIDTVYGHDACLPCSEAGKALTQIVEGCQNGDLADGAVDFAGQYPVYVTVRNIDDFKIGQSHTGELH